MNYMRWQKHLHEPFVLSALAIALTAGFGYGAGLFVARALGTPLGGWYSTLVQAHGHAQLFGWVGLFISGTGLYFLPRMRGTNLKGMERAPWALGLLVVGIALRSIVQPVAGLAGTNLLFRVLLLLSALLEFGGMVLIASMLVQTGRSAKPLSPDSPIYPVEPLVQFAFLSLIVTFLFNLLGVWNTVSQSKIVLAPRYDQFIITLLLYGAIVPMTFVFAIRTLPLFLRLEVPRREVWRTFTLIYFVALTLRLAPNLLAMTDDLLLLTGRLLRANFVNVLLIDALAVFGTLLMNVCLLVGLWQLNLTRRRGPLPDHGEYGKFSLLIYSAYLWLVVALVLDFLRAAPYLNESLFIPQDAARHALTFGFITLLIFGMAVRLLPGFSAKRAVAHPAGVLWLFVLGNLAVVLRVVPPFFGDHAWVSVSLALSGIIGWLAIALLALILYQTFRQ